MLEYAKTNFYLGLQGVLFFGIVFSVIGTDETPRYQDCLNTGNGRFIGCAFAPVRTAEVERYREWKRQRGWK